jgi:hypothetical protein
VPYNTQAADQQSQDRHINPAVVRRSVASELGAQDRAQYERDLDRRAKTSQAAAREKIARGETYDAFDANMAHYGNRLGSPEDFEKTGEFMDSYLGNNSVGGGSSDNGGGGGQQPTRRFARQSRRRHRRQQ